MERDYLGRNVCNAMYDEGYLAGVQGRNIFKWAHDVSGYDSGGVVRGTANAETYGGRISGTIYNLSPGELVLIESLSATLSTDSDTLCVHVIVCSEVDGGGEQVQISPCYGSITPTTPKIALSEGFKPFTPLLVVAYDIGHDGNGNIKYPHGKSIGMYATTNDSAATFNCSWSGSTLGSGSWGDQ